MFLLVQMDGCSAIYSPVKDRGLISVTQEVVGGHWRHMDNLFLWPQSSDLYFGVFYLQTHICSWLYLYHLPSVPQSPPSTPTIGAMGVKFPCCLTAANRTPLPASMDSAEGRVEGGRTGAGGETKVEKTESVLSPDAKLLNRSTGRDMSRKTCVWQ